MYQICEISNPDTKMNYFSGLVWSRLMTEVKESGGASEAKPRATGDEKRLIGTIASLHLQPEKSGGKMIDVDEMEFVADKGIVGNVRYFDRKTKKGAPSPRQVSWIERSLLEWHGSFWLSQKHCSSIECKSDVLSPGRVRSNIELKTDTVCSNSVLETGDQLSQLIGWRVEVGSDVVQEFTVVRTPCWQMDKLVPGLQNQMKYRNQGVLARVISSGRARKGDPVWLLQCQPAKET